VAFPSFNDHRNIIRVTGSSSGISRNIETRCDSLMTARVEAAKPLLRNRIID